MNLKTVFLTLLVSLLIVTITLAQAPQGFNYQATLRDQAGNFLVDQQVGIRINLLQGNPAGEVVYTEMHQPLTNASGLINIQIGAGTVEMGDFSTIDWSNGPYFLRLEVDETGGTNYTEMGTVQLYSVPYSLYSESVSSLKKLKVQGAPGQPVDSALFVVKRDDGQTVFAVYNDGVQVYVDENPARKRSKGGFAVGGFIAGKGLTHEFFRVTPDSVRINLDTTGTKRSKGGFAVGAYGSGKGIGKKFFNISGSAEPEIINPSEPRVLWYPLKEAFLAGRILIENPDSVGTNSFTTGFESKAIGNWSSALGYKSVAKGDFALAMGIQSRAEGFNSVAFGMGARALQESSYAFGSNVIASGLGSFAMGGTGIDENGNLLPKPTHASGDFSLAFGLGCLSSGLGSLALGANNISSGHFSIALGNRTTASGFGATSLGSGSLSFGDNAFAAGDSCVASGYGSVAMGESAEAVKDYAIAMGLNPTASGNASIALGTTTVASGEYSFAAGADTKALGFHSVALGGTAIGDHSFAIGIGTVAQSFGSLVLGRYNAPLGVNSDWVPGDPVLTIGNGDLVTPSNAFIVYKNGDIWYSGENLSVSDIRLKENFEDLSSVLPKIENIQPVYFEYRNKTTHPDNRQIGVIAQEIEKVFPELVKKDKQGFLAVDYPRMSAVLIEAVKEQQKIIQSQNMKIQQLEDKIGELARLTEQMLKLQSLNKLQPDQ